MKESHSSHAEICRKYGEMWKIKGGKIDRVEKTKERIGQHLVKIKEITKKDNSNELTEIVSQIQKKKEKGEKKKKH